MLVFFYLLLTPFVSYSQCPNNIIKNGSFELDSVGENVTGMFWKNLEGTPDIEDTSDGLTPSGATYDYGIPKKSEDGGYFQLLGNYFPEDQNQDTLNESIGQYISLITSVPHQLSFEYSSLAYTIRNADSWLGAIDVLIDGELVFTTTLNADLYVFEKVFYTFTPSKKNFLIEFRTSRRLNPATLKIMGIDGICLKPITTGFFCEP